MIEPRYEVQTFCCGKQHFFEILFSVPADFILETEELLSDLIHGIHLRYLLD